MLIYERRKLEAQLALRRWSVADFADRMGKTRQNVYAVKDGDKVTLHTINAMAETLGCDFMDLITDTDKEKVTA